MPFPAKLNIDYLFSTTDGLYLFGYYNDKVVRKWNIEEQTIEMEISI